MDANLLKEKREYNKDEKQTKALEEKEIHHLVKIKVLQRIVDDLESTIGNFKIGEGYNKEE